MPLGAGCRVLNCGGLFHGAAFSSFRCTAAFIRAVPAALPMSSINHDLLQPSLQHTGIARAPYSQTCGFACAFLGGAPSVLMLAALNAHRLGRWPRDLRWLLPGLALWIGFELGLAHTAAGQALVEGTRQLLGPRGGEILHRALALALFAATALGLHRREHRLSDLMGLDRPSGWGMGLLLIVAGNVLTYVLRTVALK